MNAVEKAFLLEIDGYDLAALNDQLALHGLRVREATQQELDEDDRNDDSNEYDSHDMYVVEKLP